jgi:transcriptional regulator with XRE-family HTH domain
MANRKNHLLRQARSRRNLTMDQLAEAARVGAATVWRAEDGRVISAESRQRLCAFLGMTAQELGLAEAEPVAGQPLQPSPALFLSLFPHRPDSSLTTHFPAAQGLAAPLSQQSGIALEQPFSTWLTLGSSYLAVLFEAGWTAEAILNALRAVLPGLQGMPGEARKTLLHMTNSALLQTGLYPAGGHVSLGEQQHLADSLSKSIDEGWHLFHQAPAAQVMILAQTLLTLVQQSHHFVSHEARPMLYTSTYNLFGATLLFQGHYEAARRAHEKAQIAALEGANTWAMAQSLNWQAIVAQVCGHFQEAMQLIEAALRLLGQQDDEPGLRLRAHLLADWAYNAAHLPEETGVQEHLEASAQLIKPLQLDEEFDSLQWQQIAGSCFLLRGKYSKAISLLEQSLAHLPAPWMVRRLLTLFPLAEAYARAGERDASMEMGTRITPLLLAQADARMFSLRWGEYRHVLQATFPHDQRIRQFLAQTQQPMLLSPKGLSD